MKKINITEIPDTWYERNRIVACSPCDNIVVYSSTSRSGDYFGLTRYYMEIKGIDLVPISERLFNAFMSEYDIYSYYEYLYLDNYCKTHRLYQSGSDIFTDD